MPCRYDGPPEPSYKQELDETTEKLCDLCSVLEVAGVFDTYAHSGIKKWWKKHKAMDAARIKREQEEAAEKKAREDALKKLTPDERKLLGIR